MPKNIAGIVSRHLSEKIKMNSQGASMKEKQTSLVKQIVPSALGWISLAVAIFIDGSFVQEFALVAVARVLP